MRRFTSAVRVVAAGSNISATTRGATDTVTTPCTNQTLRHRVSCFDANNQSIHVHLRETPTTSLHPMRTMHIGAINSHLLIGLRGLSIEKATKMIFEVLKKPMSCSLVLERSEVVDGKIIPGHIYLIATDQMGNITQTINLHPCPITPPVPKSIKYTMPVLMHKFIIKDFALRDRIDTKSLLREYSIIIYATDIKTTDIKIKGAVHLNAHGEPEDLNINEAFGDQLKLDHATQQYEVYCGTSYSLVNLKLHLQDVFPGYIGRQHTYAHGLKPVSFSKDPFAEMYDYLKRETATKYILQFPCKAIQVLEELINLVKSQLESEQYMLMDGFVDGKPKPALNCTTPILMALGIKISNTSSPSPQMVYRIVMKLLLTAQGLKPHEIDDIFAQTGKLSSKNDMRSFDPEYEIIPKGFIESILHDIRSTKDMNEPYESQLTAVTPHTLRNKTYYTVSEPKIPSATKTSARRLSGDNTDDPKLTAAATPQALANKTCYVFSEPATTVHVPVEDEPKTPTTKTPARRLFGTNLSPNKSPNKSPSNNKPNAVDTAAAPPPCLFDVENVEHNIVAPLPRLFDVEPMPE